MKSQRKNVLQIIKDHARQLIYSRVTPDFKKNVGRCNKSYTGVYFFNFANPKAVEEFY